MIMESGLEKERHMNRNASLKREREWEKIVRLHFLAGILSKDLNIYLFVLDKVIL